jgi:hypothetical protein
VLSPHIGGVTADAYVKMGVAAAQNALAVLRPGTARNLPAVGARHAFAGLHPMGLRTFLIAAIALACAGAVVAEPRILSPKDGELIHDSSGQVAVIVVDLPPGCGCSLCWTANRSASLLRAGHSNCMTSHAARTSCPSSCWTTAGRSWPGTPAVGFHVWHATRLYRRAPA